MQQEESSLGSEQITVTRPKKPLGPDHVIFSGPTSQLRELYYRSTKYGQLLVDFRFAKKYLVLAWESKNGGTDIHVIPTNEDEIHMKTIYDSVIRDD